MGHPNVRVEARQLFDFGDSIYSRVGNVPWNPILVVMEGFGPNLVTVTDKTLHVEFSARNRPHTAVAGMILQVIVCIGCSSKNALPREVSAKAFIWRAEIILFARKERFYGRLGEDTS